MDPGPGAQDRTVTTPPGDEYHGVMFANKLCGVSVIRSGESMENALRACCKGIKLGKVLIQRDSSTGPCKAREVRNPAEIPQNMYRNPRSKHLISGSVTRPVAPCRLCERALRPLLRRRPRYPSCRTTASGKGIEVRWIPLEIETLAARPWQVIWHKLPGDIHCRYVLLLDPILASGNSACSAIEVLLKHNVPEVRRENADSTTDKGAHI